MVGMHAAGASQVVIAEHFKISQGAVSKVLQKFRESGEVESRPRSGRPRILDERHKRKLHRLVCATPFISIRSISAEMALDGSPNISKSTISRVLCDDFSLGSRRPAYKPLLSAKNIRDRLQFCRLDTRTMGKRTMERRGNIPVVSGVQTLGTTPSRRANTAKTEKSSSADRSHQERLGAGCYARTVRA